MGNESMVDMISGWRQKHQSPFNKIDGLQTEAEVWSNTTSGLDAETPKEEN